ncbi:MAG: hypothetical protein KGD64_09960 [Candidatus Heimdallarchaeota archaeon]|nr:hypothetical protein [Candidatus Heimdallarchaeota archaeon]
MSNLNETYEQEKKRFQHLMLITISLLLVSVALIIIGYFSQNNDLFVFFISFTCLSCLSLVVLGAERIEMSNRFKIINE